jgi:hypothetical protein
MCPSSLLSFYKFWFQHKVAKDTDRTWRMRSEPRRESIAAPASIGRTVPGSRARCVAGNEFRSLGTLDLKSEIHSIQTDCSKRGLATDESQVSESGGDECTIIGAPREQLCIGCNRVFHSFMPRLCGVYVGLASTVLSDK